MVKRYYKKKGKKYAKNSGYKRTAKVVKKVVKSMAEKKFLDLNLDHTASSSGSLFSLLSNITKGDDADRREGDNITLTSMYVQSTVLMSPSVGETKFRMLIVRARGATTTVSMTDILKPHVGAFRVNSPVDTDKYTIIYDKVVPLTTYNKYRNLNFKLKLGSKNIQYNDSSAVPNKEYYLLTISDAGVNLPAVQGNIRIKYIDV